MTVILSCICFTVLEDVAGEIEVVREERGC